LGFACLAAGLAVWGSLWWADRAARARIARESALAGTSAGPIEFAERGSGPAVLLVHGSPGGYDQLLGHADVLARRGFRAITVSRPGYLRTPLAAGAAAPEQADALAALLDVLGLDSAAILAVSGGGPTALQYALRHPHRIRSLVLIAAVTFNPPEARSQPLRELGLRDDVVSMTAGLFPQLGFRLLGLTDPRTRAAALNDPARVACLRYLFQSLGVSDLRRAGYRNDGLSWLRQDPLDYPLRQLRVPTLAVYGALDTAVPLEHGRRVQREVTGARLVVMPDAAHPFFVTQLHEVMGFVSEFLRS
jgi:pimeloyl-ACP methyl ester carboxylesterase